MLQMAHIKPSVCSMALFSIVTLCSVLVALVPPPNPHPHPQARITPEQAGTWHKQRLRQRGTKLRTINILVSHPSLLINCHPLQTQVRTLVFEGW